MSVDTEFDAKPSRSKRPEPKDDLGGKPMTFWEHLDELRRRLIYCIIAFLVAGAVAWAFRKELLDVLQEPWYSAWRSQHLPGSPELNFSSPQGSFVGYFRLAMLGAAALAAPVIFYQLWAFIAPGLYAREKRYVIPFVFLSTVLFCGGGYFGWRVAFPISFNYFLSLAGPVSSQSVTIKATVMLGEYIDFCSQMLLAFGLIFEMPLLFLFLSLAGLVNHLHLLQYGRWFILVAFIVAAIFTPPDVPDQLAMAIPMCILYGVSIGLVYFFGKPPSEAQRLAYRNRKKKAVES